MAKGRKLSKKEEEIQKFPFLEKKNQDNAKSKGDFSSFIKKHMDQGGSKDRRESEYRSDRVNNNFNREEKVRPEGKSFERSERQNRENKSNDGYKRPEAGKYERRGDAPYKKPFSDNRERRDNESEKSYPNRKETYSNTDRREIRSNNRPPFEKRETNTDSRNYEKPSFERNERTSDFDANKGKKPLPFGKEGLINPFEKKKDVDRFNDRYSAKTKEESFPKKSFDRPFESRRAYDTTSFEDRKPYRKFDDRKFDKKRDDRKFGKSDRKRIIEEEQEDSILRLNKFVAQTGLCSRRKAAELIKQGEIEVNHVVELNPAYEIKAVDVISHKGKVIKKEEKLIYLLMNKPKNTITSANDEKGRRTVVELVKGFDDYRIFPVGRLDRNTTGLLLLTNDGELASKLSHPSFKVKKFYHVILDKNLKPSDLDDIRRGLVLEDGPAEVDAVDYIKGATHNEIGIEIHIGKNRIVRRIFEHLGYEVVKLDRTYYAGLTKKDLPRGFSRELSEQEVIMLKHFIKGK